MIEHIQANAEMTIQQMRPLSRMDFGYTRESVEWLEGYIERLRQTGEFGRRRHERQVSQCIRLVSRRVHRSMLRWCLETARWSLVCRLSRRQLCVSFREGFQADGARLGGQHWEF